MALLDGLLGSGEGSSSTSVGLDVAAAPQVGISASDILSSFGGGEDGGSGSSVIGDLGVGVALPVAVGADVSHDGDGGLLSGLL